MEESSGWTKSESLFPDFVPHVHSPPHSGWNQQDASHAQLVARERRREDASHRYAAQNPGPAYGQFGRPDWVDEEGREYRLPKAANAKSREEVNTVAALIQGYVNNGEVSRAALRLFWNDDDGDDLSVTFPEALILWMKIPIYARGHVEPPNPTIQSVPVTMYSPSTQRLLHGRISKSFVNGPGRAATGWVLLESATLSDPLVDPEPRETWLREMRTWYKEKRREQHPSLY